MAGGGQFYGGGGGGGGGRSEVVDAQRWVPKRVALYQVSYLYRDGATGSPVPNSKGTPSAGRKIHGVGKICNFRLKSPFILETSTVGKSSVMGTYC